MVWSPSKASQSACCFHSSPPVLLIYVYCSCLLYNTLPENKNPNRPELSYGPRFTIEPEALTHSSFELTDAKCWLTISPTCKSHLEKPCWASLTNHQVTHSATQKRKSGIGSQLSASAPSIWERCYQIGCQSPEQQGPSLPEDACTAHGTPATLQIQRVCSSEK